MLYFRIKVAVTSQNKNLRFIFSTAGIFLKSDTIQAEQKMDIVPSHITEHC